MARVVGIDPGTVSIDLCGLDHGDVFLDRSFPTADALADPAAFVRLLEEAGPLDLVVGPSGYGLPLVRASAATEEDFRLAFLAAEGETGGIGGLRRLARLLAHSGLPVVFTPGVIHLGTVPRHRKMNRVDLGTADKVCVAALAIHQQARRRGVGAAQVSFVLLELGGGFSAGVAVDDGRIVDGSGGTSGPLGFRSPGALDGEVAFLAGAVPKSLLFSGGAATIAGWDEAGAAPERFERPVTARERLAFDAFVESTVKAAAALAVAVPRPHEILLSGRVARVPGVREAIARRLAALAPTRSLEGFARVAKEAAQGAALIADGLAGGAQRGLVETLGILEARGTVLDHLYVISPEAARRRVGLA